MSDNVLLTVQDVTDNLGIDYADAVVTRNIERMIKTADAYLKGSIGLNYPVNDPRTKELALIIVSDLYDNRGLNETVSGNVRRLVNDFSMQLKLELASASEEVANE